jgi:hypothetical protein
MQFVEYIIGCMVWDVKMWIDKPISLPYNQDKCSIPAVAAFTRPWSSAVLLHPQIVLQIPPTPAFSRRASLVRRTAEESARGCGSMSPGMCPELPGALRWESIYG